MSDAQTHSPPPDLMARATARILRPLVRALIRSGVTFPVLADLLRAIYVEAAGELGARTDSRVSLLTGIHRKELRRQRMAADEAEPGIVTLNSRLIGRWLGDPAYAGRVLARTGAAPSFDALVTGVTKDVHPRSVLDEWVAQGIAAVEGNDVRLLTAGFVPGPGSEGKLFYFARNLHDHVAAAAANVLGGRAPFLDRSVHYDGLSAAAGEQLEAAARSAAEATLLSVNREAMAIADGDAGGRRRVNFGIYVYVADEADAE